MSIVFLFSERACLIALSHVESNGTREEQLDSLDRDTSTAVYRATVKFGRNYLSLEQNGIVYWYNVGKNFFDGVSYDNTEPAHVHDLLSQVCSQVPIQASLEAFCRFANFLHADPIYRRQNLLFKGKLTNPEAVKVLQLLVHYFLPAKDLDPEWREAVRWLKDNSRATDEAEGKSDDSETWESIIQLLLVHGRNLPDRLISLCSHHVDVMRKYAVQLVGLPGLAVAVATALAEANAQLALEVDRLETLRDGLCVDLKEANTTISTILLAAQTHAQKHYVPTSPSNPSFSPTSPYERDNE